MILDTAQITPMESGPIRGAPYSWQKIDLGNPGLQPPTTRQQNVLPLLYQFVEQNRIDDALDLLYEVIDDLLVSGSFGACERMLGKMDLNRMNADTLVGVLSITLPAKNLLAARERFLHSVDKHLRRSLSSEQTQDLLRGLR